MSDEEQVKVPFDELSPDALLGVIDDYVLREGTEYGAAEVSLARKREQVLTQLRSGTAVVMFDAASETCTIVSKIA